MGQSSSVWVCVEGERENGEEVIIGLFVHFLKKCFSNDCLVTHLGVTSSVCVCTDGLVCVCVCALAAEPAHIDAPARSILEV